MKESERQSIIKTVGKLVRGILADQSAVIEGLTARCEVLEAKLDAKVLNGRDGRDGKDGRNGIDGLNGKDCYELPILDGFDPDKNYHPGTLARKDGGLWRYSGESWTVLIDGVKAIHASVEGGQTVMLGLETTSGTVDGVSVDVPGIEYKGVWKDAEYQPGEVVTYDGSMWIALKATDGKPGDHSKTWQLCVKRGRNGRSS